VNLTDKFYCTENIHRNLQESPLIQVISSDFSVVFPKKEVIKFENPYRSLIGTCRSKVEKCWKMHMCMTVNSFFKPAVNSVRKGIGLNIKSVCILCFQIIEYMLYLFQ